MIGQRPIKQLKPTNIIDRFHSGMKPNWMPVHWNLVDARMRMSELVAQVECAAFGKVCDETLKDLEDLSLEEERERPLNEGRLLLSMDYIYKHLNRAWNGRNASMETVDRRERTDVSCWERFPTHSIFADLRPPPRLRRAPRPRVTRKGRIDPKAIHPHLQYALRKLDRLTERASGAALGTAEAPVLTEAELGRRLHRIYGELNYAWAVRKPERKGSPDRGAARRRNHFPKAFPQ